MKVAYVLSSHNSRQILRDMILPQLESGNHGAEVLGMFFIFDNTYLLLKDTDLADRLERMKEEKDLLLLACDQCIVEREIEDKLIKGADIGCFPVLYGILESENPDQIITL